MIDKYLYLNSYSKVSDQIDEESYRKKYDRAWAKLECRYSSYKLEPKFILYGCFLDTFEDFKFDFASLILFIPAFLFSFLPYAINRLTANFSKPDFIPEEHFKLDRSKKFIYDDIIDKSISSRESYDSLKDHYTSDKKEKENKAKVLNDLRLYLYQNNLTLKAKVLKEERSSKSDLDFIDSLRTGKKVETTESSVVIVTFGKEIDSLLKKVFNEEILNKDYKEIEEELSKLYQVEVKIEIVDSLERINKDLKESFRDFENSEEVSYNALGIVICLIIFVVYYGLKFFM